MDSILETIRLAVDPQATVEAKAAGVAACRAVITALEAKPGTPLATPIATSSPVAAMVASLRGVPIEQLLDLAIARLGSAVPANSEPTAKPRGFDFIRVPMPKR